MTYDDFLKSKEYHVQPTGFEADQLNKDLFDYQRDIVKWALRIGKAALFEDTGLGKTIQQLSWAEAVAKHTDGTVLILAPLAVSKQTAQEAVKFGILCNLVESQADIKKGINITNYEKVHKFDTDCFDGVVLDESSILKSYSGKTTKELQERFAHTPYKLCCTATPSPNDYTEIGTTAEFLEVMSRSEMLSTFFINDYIKKQGKNERIGWRLKRHAEKEFFRWMSTWAMMIKTPSDLGYDGSKFILPKLNIITEIIESEAETGSLFVEYADTLSERREARKESLDERVSKATQIASMTDQCLIWCDYNDESAALKKAIQESVEVKGSDTAEHKEKAMIGFGKNEVKYLVSKPSICGFGMNWQNCHDMIFCGLSDSFEQFYQAIRRCYRFGQNQEVNVHIVISEKGMNVLNNIKRKQADHERMSKEMVKIMSESAISELHHYERKQTNYLPVQEMQVPEWLPF